MNDIRDEEVLIGPVHDLLNRDTVEQTVELFVGFQRRHIVIYDVDQLGKLGIEIEILLHEDTERILFGEQIADRILDREGLAALFAAGKLSVSLIDNVDQVPDAHIERLFGELAVRIKLIDEVDIALRRVLVVQIISDDGQDKRHRIDRIFDEFIDRQRAHHGVHVELEIEIVGRIMVERIHDVLRHDSAQELHGIVDDPLDGPVAEHLDDAGGDISLILADALVDCFEQRADLDGQQIHRIVDNTLNRELIEDLAQLFGDQGALRNDIDRAQDVAHGNDLEHLARNTVAHGGIADQQLDRFAILFGNSLKGDELLELHILICIDGEHVDDAHPRISLGLVVEQVGRIADIRNVILPQRVKHRVDDVCHLEHIDAADGILMIAAKVDILADTEHAFRHLFLEHIAGAHQIDGDNQSGRIVDNVVYSQLFDVILRVGRQPVEHDVAELVFIEDLDDVAQVDCEQHIVTVIDHVVQGHFIEGLEESVVKYIHAGQHIDALHDVVHAHGLEEALHTGQIFHGQPVEYDRHDGERFVGDCLIGIAVNDFIDEQNHVGRIDVHQLVGRIDMIVIVVDTGKELVDRGRDVALEDVRGGRAQDRDDRIQRRINDFPDRSRANILAHAGFQSVERNEDLQIGSDILRIGIEDIDKVLDRPAIEYIVGIVDDVADGKVKALLHFLGDDVAIQYNIDHTQDIAHVDRIEYVVNGMTDGIFAEHLRHAVLNCIKQGRIVDIVCDDLDQEDERILDSGIEQLVERIDMISPVIVAVEEGIDLIGNLPFEDKAGSDAQHGEHGAIGIVRDVRNRQILNIVTDALAQTGQIEERFVRIAVDHIQHFL